MKGPYIYKCVDIADDLHRQGPILRLYNLLLRLRA